MIRERLGAGGYGEVWKADAPGGLSKAVKIVFGARDGNRAQRELAALNRIKQVRHPFLLSLERIERVDGHLIIVTELATSSLKQEFDKCREAGLPGISRGNLLSHLYDAADALDYISQQVPVCSIWTSNRRTCFWLADGSRSPTSAWSRTWRTLTARSSAA